MRRNERMPMKLVGPELRRENEIEAVLRSLPQWFGIERALLMYVADSATRPTLAVEIADELVGFLTLTRHFALSWEVHCMAVVAPRRNGGIGSYLLHHAERYVRQQGGRFLQVKTVAETSDCAAYAQTRRFHEARGFTPLEVFPTLWDPRNPALQLVKVLNED
jgi:GNAT superfamily N-acetyltransferase